MAGTRKDPNRGMVVAKEAVVVIVGARPITYEQITVVDRRTGQPVTMNSDRVEDQGDEGISYAFKAYQRVPKNHPAVKEAPGAFMEIEDLDESELELVAS